MKLALFSLLDSAIAIPDEFPGYFHYHNANMADPYPPQVMLTNDAFQTQCDTNVSCHIMRYPGRSGYTGWLSPVSQDASMDTYYKNSSCGDQCSSSTPQYVSGGLYAPDTVYMKCSGCKMFQNSVSDYLNLYILPPSQCAATCNNDARCVAMSITNDRQKCYTYTYVGRSYDAYLKLPLYARRMPGFLPTKR